MLAAMKKFAGYTNDTWKFFRDLKRNNRREWFLKNRPRYEENVVAPSALLVAQLNAVPFFKKLDLSARPEKALFRIHRDMRFSLDKTPYKTHAGLVLTRRGIRKDHAGCFYLHLEPGSVFIATGFWQPAPAFLYLLRQWAVENPAKAKKILQPLMKSPIQDEQTLTRLPRGFQHVEDPFLQALLLRKHWVVALPLNEKQANSGTLVKTIEKFMKQSEPLLKLGWSILDQWRAEGGDPFWQELQHGKKIARESEAYL